jgi:hypothetical protein
MIELRCVCQAVLAFDDEMAGKTIPCPECRWPLVVPQVPLHRPGHCLMCDQERPTAPSYLLLSQVESTAFGKRVRAAFLKCFLCDPCFGRLNWLYYLRPIGVFASIGVMALFGVIGSLIASTAEPGKHSALHTSVFVSFFVLSFVSVPAGCLLIYQIVGRKMARLVSPAASRCLGSLGVVTSRGWMPVLVAYRSLPALWTWWLLFGQHPPIIDPLAADGSGVKGE